MSQFKYVGSTTRSSSRTSWPLEAQALIIKTNVKDGVGGARAFELAVANFNSGVASGVFEGPAITLPLPKSYTNKNAGSVLYGMKERFLKRAEKGDAETLALAEKYGLIEPRA